MSMTEIEGTIGEFVPRPGSATDRVQRGINQATPSAAASIETLPARLDAIPVLAVNGDEGVYSTMSLAASGIRQLLPQDPQRYRAVVLAIDQDVVLCATKELAQAAANTATSVPYPTGFYLSKGIPLTIQNKGLIWVANTSTGTATRVSVVVEKYADPQSVGLG